MPRKGVFTAAPRVPGVYAVLVGPMTVYVGESGDARRRAAARAHNEHPWGIVRECHGLSRIERVRIERDVIQMFRRRGFNTNQPAYTRRSPYYRRYPR